MHLMFCFVFVFLQKSTGSSRRSRSAATTEEMIFRPTMCRRSQLRPPTRQHRRRRNAADHVTRPSSSLAPPLNRARTLHHPHRLIRTLSLTMEDTRAMLGADAAERSNFFGSVAVQSQPNLPPLLAQLVIRHCQSSQVTGRPPIVPARPSQLLCSTPVRFKTHFSTSFSLKLVHLFCMLLDCLGKLQLFN